MSRAQKMSDAVRTDIMLDLVRLLHEPEHGDERASARAVVLQEVAPSTGWSGVSRWADVLALGIWRDTGQRLDGYEIKASKADLKRELASPTKHEAVARYCHTWTLVAWDEAMLLPDIPEWWGVTVTEPEPDDEFDQEARRLRVVRKPTMREPEPWTPGFIRSLVRNAYTQGPRAEYVARAASTAFDRGYGLGKREGREESRLTILGLRSLLYPGVESWRQTSDTDQILADVRARLTQLPLAATPEGR